MRPDPAPEGRRRLRMLFFLDYVDGATGTRFKNSPGLLPLIEHTRRQGFDIEFIATEDDLLHAVTDREVDVLGISSMERLLPRSIPLARKVRSIRPDLPLVIGGNSIDPFAVELAAGLFDVVVLKEADHLLPALLAALADALGRWRPEAPTPEVDLPGRSWRVANADPGGALSAEVVDALFDARFQRRSPDGRLAGIGLSRVLVRDSERNAVWRLEGPETGGSLGIEVDPSPLEAELSELCRFPWDLVEREGWKDLELYSQRGCRWGQCLFCSVSDDEIRCVPPERVVEVIAEAVEHGINVISFADNLFVQYKDWNRRVLEGVIERGLRVTFRAQTMANRTVWPLLDLMREAGFSEIAFGLETLLPERAERMAKSFHGPGYIRQARETIERTAAAGIFPVLYLIMADPESTLVRIAAELEVTVRFIADIYRRTGIVPKPSYSPVLLPVAGTRLTSQYETITRSHPLGRRVLEIPDNFCFSPGVVDYLNQIGRATDDMVCRRENLKAYPLYFDALLAAAREHSVSDLPKIEDSVQSARRTYEELLDELDRDIENAARSFERGLSGESETLDLREIDFRRFGPYLDGIERFGELLSETWQARSET